MLLKELKYSSIQSWLSSALLRISPETALQKLLQQRVQIKAVAKLEEIKSVINKTITKLQREILRNPRKVMELLDKKLNVEDKRKISNLLSSNNEGTQVFLSSSWIQWAIWVPIAKDSNKGALTLKLRTYSANNPSGVYTFPLHGHPHGYGNYVDKSVYEILRFSSSAGTDFWRVFYRAWYNTHRGIGYLQAPKNKGK